MNASRRMAERLRNVERHEASLPAEAAVHEMRVATRRLRAALRMFRLQRLDRAVKALQDALGELRDLQLLTAWLRKRDGVLARASERKERRAEKALRDALRSWREEAMPALLDAAAQARPPSRRRVRKMVRKRLERLGERLDDARTRPTPRALHRTRISVKQVRYLVELGKPHLPRAAAGLLPDLKTLQASLGQLHDAQIRIALLRSRPALLREQREARDRIAKIVVAQLSRWRKQKVAARALKHLA